MLNDRHVETALALGRMEPITDEALKSLSRALADATLAHGRQVGSWRPWGACWRGLGGWAGLAGLWTAQHEREPDEAYLGWLSDWAVTLDSAALVGQDPALAQHLAIAGAHDPGLLYAAGLWPVGLVPTTTPGGEVALAEELVLRWVAGGLDAWVCQVRDAVFEGRVQDAQAALDGWQSLARTALDGAAMWLAVEGQDQDAQMIGESAEGVSERRRTLAATFDAVQERVRVLVSSTTRS